METNKPIEEQISMDELLNPQETPAGEEKPDAVAAAIEELKREIEAHMAEALRVGGMTDDERAQYGAASREEALAARERELTRRELRAEAKERLTQCGLPASLSDAVNCDDRDQMARAVAALEVAFREAVQTAVEARLSGNTPVAGATAQTGDDIDDVTWYKMQGI